MQRIADEIKKLNPTHVRYTGADSVPVKSTIQDVLNEPNPLMTQSEFLEKCTYLLLMNYNLFIIPIYRTWTDEQTGEAVKCRPDCLIEVNGRKYIVDYKTTDSCEDGHFERSCRKYGYKLQAGMYREGVFQNTLDDYGFVFVAQEKKAPYAVRVYVCSEEFICEGYDQYRELLGLYHHCKEHDNWYGYDMADLIGEGE